MLHLSRLATGAIGVICPVNLINGEIAMFGMFKKKVAAAGAAVKKVENRDFMEASIGIMVLVAFADGNLEPQELDKLNKVVQTLPELQGFGSEIGQTIDKYVGYFEIGFSLGKNRILKELRDIKADEMQKTDILSLGVVAAMADGDLEPAEQAILEQVAREFGLKLDV